MWKDRDKDGLRRCWGLSRRAHCLCCTIFVTILWFSVRKGKEKAENSSPQTTPQSRMATLFLKRVFVVGFSRGQTKKKKKFHTFGSNTDWQRTFNKSMALLLLFFWRRLPPCAVDGESRQSGCLLHFLFLPPMSLLLLEFFPWYSSPRPFLIFFSFLAYHSFAFSLEVCRGNQRRLEQNKNHLHLSQALHYLSQLWWKTKEETINQDKSSDKICRSPIRFIHSLLSSQSPENIGAKCWLSYTVLFYFSR